MSDSLLALSLFFHISSTVIWIGGLFIMVLLVWPEMRRVLDKQPELYRMLSRLRSRFYPISYICLAVLIVTGLFQMTADPFYDGVMQFTNQWSQVMLIKHLAIAGMVVTGVLLQSGVIPALERTSLLVERDKGDIDEWQKLRQREILLTWVSVILGFCVLALSAWAGSL